MPSHAVEPASCTLGNFAIHSHNVNPRLPFLEQAASVFESEVGSVPAEELDLLRLQAEAAAAEEEEEDANAKT